MQITGDRRRLPAECEECTVAFRIPKSLRDHCVAIAQEEHVTLSSVLLRYLAKGAAWPLRPNRQIKRPGGAVPRVGPRGPRKPKASKATSTGGSHVAVGA